MTTKEGDARCREGNKGTMGTVATGNKGVTIGQTETRGYRGGGVAGSSERLMGEGEHRWRPGNKRPECQKGLHCGY